MSKIGDYEIVTANTVDLLTDAVKKKLEHGWKPLGAPLVTGGMVGNSIPPMIQAMTKKRPRA